MINQAKKEILNNEIIIKTIFLMGLINKPEATWIIHSIFSESTYIKLI